MTDRSISKIIRDQSTEIITVPCWSTQNCFPLMIQVVTDHSVKQPETRKTLTLPSNCQTTSFVSKITITGSYVIWKALRRTELSNEIKEIIYDSWKTKTITRYEGFVKKWWNCPFRGICSYHGICAAWSALSNVVMIEGYDNSRAIIWSLNL